MTASFLIRKSLQSEQCGTATHFASLYIFAPNFDEVTSVCTITGDPLRHHRERLRGVNGEAGAVAVKIRGAETIWIEVTPALVANAKVPLAFVIVTALLPLAFVRPTRGGTATAHVWRHSLCFAVAFPNCTAQKIAIATRKKVGSATRLRRKEAPLTAQMFKTDIDCS